jgi:hypothetical protein
MSKNANSKSAVQEIAELQKQIEERRTEAVAELMPKYRAALDTTNALKQQIVSLGGSVKVCSVCGEWGHSARKHKKDADAKSDAKKQ